MSRGEEKAKPWQFSIRGLLIVTALTATVTGFYCIHPGLGFFLTVIMMALWGGRLLRRDSFDGEFQRNYGIFASIGGGALAGGCQLAIVFLWQGMSGPSWIDPLRSVLWGFVIGAFFGGQVGFLVWLGWLIVVVCYQSLREFVGRLR